MWKNSQIFYHIFKPNNEIDIQFFSIECHIAYVNHSRNYWPTATLWRFHFDQRVIKICLIFFWCFEVLWLEFMVTQRTNFVKLELFFYYENSPNLFQCRWCASLNLERSGIWRVENLCSGMRNWDYNQARPETKNKKNPLKEFTSVYSILTKT